MTSKHRKMAKIHHHRKGGMKHAHKCKMRSRMSLIGWNPVDRRNVHGMVLGGRKYPYSSVRQDVRNRMRYLSREKLSEVDYRIAASVLGRKRVAARYP